MADSKDGEGFLRKMVRFVANPATDWSSLNSTDEARNAELERGEIKAMVERKRRNDFVRKREFDMLRRLRRENLTAEQLAALGSSSRLDDSEVRASEGVNMRADSGVKAKIDAIEQQMVGDGRLRSRPLPLDALTTAPAVLSRIGQQIPSRYMPTSPSDGDNDLLPALPPLPAHDEPDAPLAPRASQMPRPATFVVSPAAPPPAPPAPARVDARALGPGGFEVEVSEVMHDPDLDEAVIAFANADFDQCEASLSQLVHPGGKRAQHAETWLVLFDLYRATGQQQRFETLANEYAHQFGWSAPQWFSMPKLVADAAAAAEESRRPGRTKGPADAGWLCPANLDVDTVARLRSQSLQMPLPWVFEWGALRTVEAEAATNLAELFMHWATQPVEMRWLNGQRLLEALHEAAPTGVRDADPAFWLARMGATRLANRPDQFDEVAIDYCVTYEVSPPAYEPAKCKVSLLGSGSTTMNSMVSMISEMPSSFLESDMQEDGLGTVHTAHLELSGQLMGDISTMLQRMNEGLGVATGIHVSCANLIRVDFIAAGDLLNWVLSKRNERRSVLFGETHRLVALFFGAMGINEHARVQVRKV